MPSSDVGDSPVQIKITTIFISIQSKYNYRHRVVTANQSAHYATLFFNGHFYSDFYLIKRGAGKDSPLYLGLCQPLLDERDALIDQYEINKYTGEYDAKQSWKTLLHTESQAEIFRTLLNDVPRLQAREAHLTGKQRSRVIALREDLQEKLERAIKATEYFISNYPGIVAFGLFEPVVQSIFIVIFWMFVAKFYFSGRVGFMAIALSTLHLVLGMLAGATITALLALSIFDIRLHSQIGLPESKDLLRHEYENHGWACGGHFDPKGLW
jgi:hypothetical protein